MGAAGREVDHRGDRHRYGHEDRDGHDVLGVGDGERVDGRGEVPVQEQRSDRRRGQRGEESAEQGRRHRQGQVQQHVVGQADFGGDTAQQPGEQQRSADSGQPAPDDPGPAEPCAPVHGESASLARLVVGDEVDVEVGAGLPGDRRADAGPEDVLPALAAGDAEDDLGGVDAAREVQQRGRYVLADDMVEGAAQVLDEGALLGEFPRGGRGEAVAAGDVDRQHLAARALFGQARGPADESASLGPAGQAHDDPLTGAPDRRDAVFAAVLLEVGVDPVG